MSEMPFDYVYAAGYVVKHLEEQLKRGSHPVKEELVTCLVDMCEPTEEDIGSRWPEDHQQKTFDVFLAIERRVRDFFRVSTSQNLTTETKKIMKESVTSNEVVRSYWDTLATTAEWDKAEEKALFPMLDCSLSYGLPSADIPLQDPLWRYTSEKTRSQLKNLKALGKRSHSLMLLTADIYKPCINM